MEIDNSFGFKWFKDLPCLVSELIKNSEVNNNTSKICFNYVNLIFNFPKFDSANDENFSLTGDDSEDDD